MEENKNDIQKLQDRLRANAESLHISRIPFQTKKRFRDIADNDFCGDYGMLLKYLTDLYDGIMNVNTQELLSKQAELEQRVLVLENSQKTNSAPIEPGKKIKFADGREVNF